MHENTHVVCPVPDLQTDHQGRRPYGMPSCLVASLEISSGSWVPARSISITLRATISQMGSLRSTRLSERSVNVKARLSLSTSSGLILPSLNSRLIGIVEPLTGGNPNTAQGFASPKTRPPYCRTGHSHLRNRLLEKSGTSGNAPNYALVWRRTMQ